MASSDALPGPRRPRPMSPHLSIYRLTMTMAMSLAHRISGLALYGGVLLLAWFLIAQAERGSLFSLAAFYRCLDLGNWAHPCGIAQLDVGAMHGDEARDVMAPEPV